MYSGLILVCHSGDWLGLGPLFQQHVTMLTCSVLPWRTAGISVAVATDGSWFLDVGAEHPVNHLPISLSPAAKPCVLFPWQPEITVNTDTFIILVT